MILISEACQLFGSNGILRSVRHFYLEPTLVVYNLFENSRHIEQASGYSDIIDNLSFRYLRICQRIHIVGELFHIHLRSGNSFDFCQMLSTFICFASIELNLLPGILSLQIAFDFHFKTLSVFNLLQHFFL